MPRFNFPHNLEAPAPPDVYELAIFPVAVVPYALAALESRATAYTWSPESNVRGNQLIRSLQMALLTGGMDAFLEGQNRIYRLLDNALNGRVYTLDSEEPLVISPAISAVPEPLDPPAGIVAMLDQLPGILDAGWFGIGGHKATLADVVNALRVGNSEAADSLLDQLNGILGAGGNVAQIGDLVADLFTGSVSAVEEGGIFVLLAAGIVGQLATTGALSAQMAQLLARMTRISNSIDGGTLLPPGDSLLVALRGETEAGADRNVIDAAGNAAALDKLDSIIAELGTNHDDNGDLLAKLEAIRTELV